MAATLPERLGMIVGQALAPAGLDPVIGQLAEPPVAGFGHRQQQAALPADRHADHLVSFAEGQSLHAAAARPTTRASFSSKQIAMPSRVATISFW